MSNCGKLTAARARGSKPQITWRRCCCYQATKCPPKLSDIQFERGGYRTVALWQLNYSKALSTKQYVSPVDLAVLAVLSAQLGNREETGALLEEGYRHHSPGLLWIRDDPAFDFLHSDDRYRSIIKGIGLPPAY